MAKSLSMRVAPTPIFPRHAESTTMNPDPILSLPPTPPYSYKCPERETHENMKIALHAIRTERDALDNLQRLYSTDEAAQQGLNNAVNAILESQHRSGKLVITGVGKSAIVGRKAVATLTSLHIQCRFLDPSAALHGDLGMISENDALMFISYSSRTRELVEVVSTISKHLNMDHLPLIAVTGQTKPSDCALFDHYPSKSCILLPAPIPISETETFGVPAPTTSTTVAFATLDALALVLADRYHPEPAKVFHRYHPGGAIGAHHAQLKPGFTE